MSVQWVHLGAGQTLVAANRGAWIQRPQLGALALTGQMPDSLPASSETTRYLLDGAIGAAEREAPRLQLRPTTLQSWAHDLASQWYCAHHSVALLPELIERFAANDRRDLAAFAQDKFEEESGH